MSMKTKITAESLNLYTSNPVEAKKAALAFEVAFLHAHAQIVEGRMRKDTAFNKLVAPLMDKYAHVGASDSDARDSIWDLFNSYMKDEG